jgi:hypothetical protein
VKIARAHSPQPARLYLSTAPKPNTVLLGTHFYSPSEEGYEGQVKGRLARWRAAQEKALGIEQAEELPELSEAEVIEIKRRTMRGGERP